MGQTELKIKLLERCKQLQRESVENTRAEMVDAQDSAYEHQPRDQYDSYRDQMMGKRDMFAKQLQQSLDQLKLLERIDPAKLADKVDFGSAVITEDQKLFIAIGIGKFEVDNETWFAISPLVPIFQSMRGLKKGDTFLFREKKIKILDVF
jgi:transcription elongation GreA/GreB family factor